MSNRYARSAACHSATRARTRQRRWSTSSATCGTKTAPAGPRYREPDWSQLHAFAGLKLHLYGKHHARHGRKMGHFTVVDDDPQQARERALAARAAIGIVDAS